MPFSLPAVISNRRLSLSLLSMSLAFTTCSKCPKGALLETEQEKLSSTNAGGLSLKSSTEKE